jgi:hypothetical protein
MLKGGKGMNKKILMVSILAVLMLVTISFATAINTTPAKKKESPLFGIKTELAIEEKIQNLRDNVKAKYVGERLFFLPFQFPRDNNPRDALQNKVRSSESWPCGFSYSAKTCLYYYTCYFPAGNCGNLNKNN